MLLVIIILETAFALFRLGEVVVAAVPVRHLEGMGMDASGFYLGV